MCVCLRAQSRPKTIRACVHIHVYAPPDAIALPQALIPFCPGSPCSGGPGAWPDLGAWSQAGDRVTLNPPGRLRSGYRVLVGRDERWPRSSIWPRRIKFWREARSASLSAHRSQYASPVLAGEGQDARRFLDRRVSGTGGGRSIFERSDARFLHADGRVRRIPRPFLFFSN